MEIFSGLQRAQRENPLGISGVAKLNDLILHREINGMLPAHIAHTQARDARGTLFLRHTHVPAETLCGSARHCLLYTSDAADE